MEGGPGALSWHTHPIRSRFPMLRISASTAVVGIQIGYCVSAIRSGVSLVIYRYPMPICSPAWHACHKAVVGVIGYCVSDFISKCSVGLMICFLISGRISDLRVVICTLLPSRWWIT